MFLKIQKLSEELQAKFNQVSTGHCLRVDDLPFNECIELCECLKNLPGCNFSAYVLEPNSLPPDKKDYIISTDVAIEKRNLQQESICLIIPTNTNHSAISSLGNSFENFDTQGFLGRLEKELLTSIPSDIKDAVKKSINQAKKTTSLQTEDIVCYLNEIYEKPTLKTAGTALWEIGLIPHKTNDFIESLKHNYDCVKMLAYPVRPQTTIRQRLEATKLKKGHFMDRLEQFLLEKPMEPPAKNWLKRFVNEGDFDFSKWEFPEIQPSDLEEIKLNKPKRKPDGSLVTGCGDIKCEDLDAPIIAECGARKKISVLWSTEPRNVQNVANWQVELIPSREDYDEDADSGELPQVRKNAKQRSGQISLDIDVEDLEIKWVQVRVTGLDENGTEIVSENGSVIEALSERIYLQQNQIEDVEPKHRLKVAPNLPFGYLEIAQTYAEEEWRTTPQSWKTGDIDYFSVLVGDSSVCRIGISNILRAFEEKSIRSFEDFGRYSYKVDDLDKFNEQKISIRPPYFAGFPSWIKDAAERFKEQRKVLFKHIGEKCQQNGIVETAIWESEFANTTLFNRAKLYADAYIQLLETILNAKQQAVQERQEMLEFFLSIDSVELEICYHTGNQKALILLPTHPHRMLWFSAYASLLNDWREKLLKLPKRHRKDAIDLNHLKEITPANTPFIIPSASFSEKNNWYIFSRNIGFSFGLFLPPACPDWTRVSVDVLHFLSYDDEITPTDVQPKRISDDIEKYIKIHPYCKERGLNIGVVNPGNGNLLAKAIRNLLISGENSEEDTEKFPKVKRLEISSIARPPLPIEIEGFEDVLHKQFYLLENIADDASTLSPAFALSLTERTERPNFPNGEQHVSFNFDAANPQISLEQLSEILTESISFYGLMNRWQSDSSSEYGQLKWRYWLAVSKPERFERHPVDPKFTDFLLNISKQQSSSLAFLLDTSLSQDTICCLSSIIGPDERGFIEYLHQQSDWVLTIDRFFGPDFFDSPNDPFLSELSKKYLIDYSPDFSEGIGDRLLVTTCWQDELTQIIASKLEKINLSSNEESVLNLVNALKSLSGTYALQLFEEDNEQNQKTIAIGVTLHYLLQNKGKEKFLLIPVYCHPDIFDDAVNLCDFLLISATQQDIKITCIDSLIETGLSSRSSILEKINERFLKTEELLQDKYFSGQQEESQKNIGAALERSRLVMLIRYYLSKAVRYNLIDKERFGKFSELFSKVEAGKIQLNILKRAFLISPDENEYKIELPEQDEIKVTILGKYVLSEPPQPPDYGEQGITGSDEELPFITEEQNREEILTEQPSDIGSIKMDEVDSTDIPSYPESIEIILGKSVNEQDIIWKPSVKGSPHVLILGIPGQGKSVTINTLLVELQRKGIGTLTFDFHGQFSDERNAFRKLCLPTIWNAAEGLPFSPFEADLAKEIGQQSWKTQSFALADIFAYVFELGDIQKDGVFRAISACYEDAKNSIDNTFPTINDLKKKIERLEGKREIRNVLAKCRPLLEMNVFNPQAFESGWDILKSTKKGLVINVKEIGSETVQLAISAFVLRKVYKEILKWEESTVLKLAIVLDEAHRLARDKTLPLIMQEARKFGVLVIVASQNINHFHENVLGNAGTKILFRTNNPDSKKVSKMVQMRSSSNAQSIIEQLKTGQAVVQTPEMNYNYAGKTMMRKID